MSYFLLLFSSHQSLFKYIYTYSFTSFVFSPARSNYLISLLQSHILINKKNILNVGFDTDTTKKKFDYRILLFNKGSNKSSSSL
jgi:hypothetical protein